MQRQDHTLVEQCLACSKLYSWLLHLSGMGVLLDLQHILQPCLLQTAESHHVGVLCCSTAKDIFTVLKSHLASVQALKRFVAAAAAAESSSDLPELAQRLVMAQIQRALAATNLAVRQVCWWPII